MTDTAATRKAIEAVWRIESPALVATLTRLVRDVGLAEDIAQDAFLSAMQQWPADGIPDKPGAWLMSAAKNRGIDRIRRERRLREITNEQGVSRAEPYEESEIELADDRLDGVVQDDLLRLIFMTCHPMLPDDARAAITLRLLCGLSTDEIARAFLVPEPTIAQRIVRAKRTLSEQRVAFEVPRGNELDERLASVLEVVYLLFNEGYSATAGDDWMRPALCDEAMRLGRVLAGLMPGENEVLGLVALMEMQASRTRARTDAQGRPVLLLDQNRALWDQVLIRHGLGALDAAERLSGEPGRYLLQARIAACHATARTAAQTDWRRIAALYGELAGLTQSPIVELNRGVAVGMAFGPAAGLAVVDAIASAPALRRYHLLPSVRGDLLAKLDRHREAAAEFARAAEMTCNAREREILQARASASSLAAAGAEVARR